jgi:hypothetical protein
LSNEEKRMINMKILKKGGSREKGGGGNEIHAPVSEGSIDPIGSGEAPL